MNEREKEIERERVRERASESERKRDRARESDRERKRARESEREPERARESERERERARESERERERERGTEHLLLHVQQHSNLLHLEVVKSHHLDISGFRFQGEIYVLTDFAKFAIEKSIIYLLTFRINKDHEETRTASALNQI